MHEESVFCVVLVVVVVVAVVAVVVVVAVAGILCNGYNRHIRHIRHNRHNRHQLLVTFQPLHHFLTHTLKQVRVAVAAAHGLHHAHTKPRRLLLVAQLTPPVIAVVQRIAYGGPKNRGYLLLAGDCV